MRIEIWSDVICPWCGLGQHRLDAALADFPHKGDVEVVHRSFQLDPSFPLGTTVTAREMLAKKYNMNEAQHRAATGRIEALAAADGLAPYRVGSAVVGNTRQAHELLALAADRGMEDAAWKALYRAYFGEGRSLFDVDSLVAIGVEVGLIEADIREALASGLYKAKVEADGREARQLGCNGVPFVVIDRRIGIAGAQPTETFRGAIEKAWNDNVPPVAHGEGRGRS
jgi:predicted DsbA family dithiol-disulfide isomerase